MNADAPPADVENQNYVWLLNLLAVTQIALLLATSLWLPPYAFPQVPLFAVFRHAPRFLELAAFVGSLAGTFFARTAADKFTRRIRHGVCAASFAVLFAFNQHRIQPWAYQLMVLHAWLALANPQWRLVGWRWLTISIYFYSALSKVDFAFCVNHGPFLLDGFLHSLHFADVPPSVSFVLSALMPLTELLTAILLCFPRTQRVGLYFSIAMHLFLMIALGPLGHDHSAGVLIWNAFFIVQNWLLFAPPVKASLAETPSRKEAPRGQNKIEIAGWVLLAFVLIAPLGEPFGFWDHWPSWAVYAARPEQAVVAIHEDDLPRVPEELRKYLQPSTLLEPWHPVRLDRWSLNATRAPIYPQSRFHVGVALALAERSELTTLRVTIFSSPNRWTGQRERKDFIGLDAVQELAETYACNAQPRH